MLNTRLNHEKWTNKAHFTVIQVSEKMNIDDEIKSFLNKEILESYVWVNYLVRNYKKEDKKLLIDFLENSILPSVGELHRVWQWDLWEIISKLIVVYFNDLEVPATKLKLKTNKDKSMFWTDMISHNKWDIISEWFYYEVKTTKNLTEKNYKIKWTPRYITVVAYDGLKNDIDKSCEAIAVFLSKVHDEKWDYDKADMYWKIADWRMKVNKEYKIFIIWEKSSYKEEILDSLDAINPSLSPLNVTIVLIDGFKELIEELRNKIWDDAIKLVYS